MNQIIILRDYPKLEIILQQDDFKVLDNSNPNNNGIYSFSSLKLTWTCIKNRQSVLDAFKTIATLQPE